MGVSTGELQVSRKIDTNICELTIFIDLSDVPWYTFKQVSQASQVSKKKTRKDSTVLRQTPAFLWVFLENERLILGLSKSGRKPTTSWGFRDRCGHHMTNIHHLPTNPGWSPSLISLGLIRKSIQHDATPLIVPQHRRPKPAMKEAHEAPVRVGHVPHVVFFGLQWRKMMINHAFSMILTWIKWKNDSDHNVSP